MKVLTFFLFMFSACYGQFDSRLKSVARTQVPAVDINRMYDSADWQIRISDPAVKRVDLRFAIQDEIVIETWLIDELNDPERILDIAIGPLRDIELGQKWRIYAAIRGRNAGWCRTVDIPKITIGGNASYSAGPVLQDDGSFGLVFFDISTHEGKKYIPLKVFVTLSTTTKKAEPATTAQRP